MEIPKQLETGLKQGKIIPFVGAGVSMAVRTKAGNQPLFPSWPALLTAAAQRLREESKPAEAGIVEGFVKTNRLLDAAKEAKDALAANWCDFLKSQLDKTRDQADDASLELARRVWRLGSQLVITTNYDNVLRWACPQSADLAEWKIQAPAEQSELLKRGVDKPTVWHLHGHIDDRANLILSPDGYQKLYGEGGEQRYQAALHTLQQLLASHSLLFIGFSFADQDFAGQLQKLEAIFQGNAGPHYVLLPEAQKSLFNPPSNAIQPLFFADYGAPLLDCLDQLAGLAEQRSAVGVPPAAVADFSPDKPAFNVPFPPKGEQLVGRSEALEQAHRQLRQNQALNITQTASFHGMGGLGKTQLAVEYAHSYRSDYPNGVIWINADQDITAQLIKLAEDAHWVSPLSDQPTKIDIAQHRLRESAGCLLIFDNLEKLEDIRDYLPQPTSGAHVLVTSRLEQPGFPPIPLELLKPEQGFALLVQVAGRQPSSELEQQAAQDIVKQLDGLPLALELAGAYLRWRPSVGCAEYLELLRDNLKAAFPAKLRENSATRHDADLYSTLKVHETLFEEEPLLREVLDLLTWSGAAAMHSDLLCAALGQEKPSALTNALGLGVSLRLLQKSEDGRYALHRLLRQVRREETPLAGRRDWAEQCGRRLGDWFQAHRDDFRDLPAFEAGLDHLQAWQNNAAALGMPLLQVRLAWLQAYPPYHWGHYQEAQRIVQCALDLFQVAGLADEALRADLLNDLARFAANLGNKKMALVLNEQALTIRRDLFGEENADTARSLANAASYQDRLGKHERALDLGRQALAIHRRLFGEEHPDTATSLGNVASYYGYLGKYDQALELGQQALAIRRRLFGENHPGTAHSLDSVGGYYNSQGKFREALQLAQQAQSIQQKLLGATHPDTLLSQHNVIRALANAGRKAEAVQCFNAVFPLLRPDQPHYQLFLQLRADLFPGFRKPGGGSGKSKKRRR